ncbi:MAG: 4Fe-4S dicluster domain-containing protein [Acidobacteriia bacterium]|nr:4Fe-4S dicluster domain-containing protein [Terriglobia bacterium]
MLRTLKYQREADPEWARQVSERPGCEGLFSCLQCGACSGSCPLSIYMDLTPRRVIALVREGFRRDALSSMTIWLCASCYSCAANCPRQIHVTDLMYSLKREAIRSRLYPPRLPAPILAQEFYAMVRKHGRNSEFWLVLRMALRSNPLLLLTMLRNGWDLVRTGRLSLRRERIHGTSELVALSGAGPRPGRAEA